ncbi:MAG: HAMP domain-containing histidine kinase [Defluviitaleaceae bacterium]|nr:HAMP domain-containing histidine kinase [Defluviitaleaceae bacterium]
MFKTVFAKQFAFYFTIQLFSYILLAVALSYVFNSFFMTQQTHVKQDSALRVAELYYDGFTGRRSPEEVNRLLDIELFILSEYQGFSLIIIGPDHEVFYVSPDIEQHTQSISGIFGSFDFSALERGEQVVIRDNMEGIFSEQVLMVGQPVLVGDALMCSVFVSSTMPDLQRSAREIITITIISLMISGSLSFMLVFLLSRTMTRPILEMSKTAMLISGGDFEKRIDYASVDEIGQLAKSLNDMAESLHRQEMSRRLFIENVSHDLRSPLTSIRGFLQAILDGTIPPEKHEHYLNVIREETERLSKLTHDIIDLENMSSPEITLNRTRFELNELIRKIVVMFEATARNKRLAVSLVFADESNIVFADQEKISRVLYNLIDNAVKFCADGGNVEISTGKKDKKVIISVKDDGKGIPKELQKQVFERFFKVDPSRGEDRKGSGLGLSIVSAFLRAHNEVAGLRSGEGEGSVFTFELPLAAKEKEKKDKDKDKDKQPEAE